MSERLILFVCTANQCRSPMAECLLRSRLPPDSAWSVSSAGLAAWPGQPGSRLAVLALAEVGMDMTAHRSRQVEERLVDAAAIVAVMTAAHREEMQTLFPGAADRLYLLRTFDPAAAEADLDDPVGSTIDVYRRIRDQIAAALPGLLAYLDALGRRAS